mmetsp:Transcript_16093/g.39162  ORF Transcript_16093/g.39162 Transcript_16093/m.39162 type:complete len:425 (-) Transcript_16093:68-1342(-)
MPGARLRRRRSHPDGDSRLDGSSHGRVVARGLGLVLGELLLGRLDSRERCLQLLLRLADGLLRSLVHQRHLDLRQLALLVVRVVVHLVGVPGSLVPAEEQRLDVPDHAPPDGVPDGGRDQVVRQELADADVGAVHHPKRHDHQVSNGVLEASHRVNGEGDVQRNDLAKHVPRGDAHLDGEADQEVGGDGAQEDDPRVHADLGLRHLDDVRVGGVLREEVRQISKHPHPQDAPHGVPEEARRPVVKESHRGDPVLEEAHRHEHAVARVELAAEDHDEVHGDGGEEGEDELLHHREVAQEVLLHAARRREGEAPRERHPEPRERPQEANLPGRQRRLLHAQDLNLVLHVVLQVDLVLQREVVERVVLGGRGLGRPGRLVLVAAVPPPLVLQLHMLDLLHHLRHPGTPLSPPRSPGQIPQLFPSLPA